MRFYSLMILLGAGLLLAACGPSNGEATEGGSEDLPLGDNSRNALDWDGTYVGVTPCASCEGIRTRITLHEDGTYDRSLTYLGESPMPVVDSGSFSWNDAGSAITLPGENGGSQMYQVGENVLFHLDQDGNRITGDLAPQYRLVKTVSNPQLEGKTWTLAELNGQPYEPEDGVRKPYITFQAEDKRASGFNFCNNFTGPYDLLPGNRIQFRPNMAATLAACPEGDREAAFMEMLRTVDNYSISDNTLSLNRARMAPLARFTLAEE